MPPVLLPDTNGVIMDDFLLSVQAVVTKTSASTINTCMHAWSVIAGDQFFFPITVRCCCTNRTTTKLHVGVVFDVSLWCLMASGHIINLSDLIIAFGVE